MISQPTYKVCRRLGAGVYDKCQTQKFVLSEAKHAKSARRGRRNVSDFARQLLEKQKVRFAYGINERQLRRYVEEAQRAGAQGQDSSVRLLEQLEMRLDNAVYRCGLAPSRRAARQMVSHGHIAVNGRRTTVPSYMLREEDTFVVRERTKAKPIMELAKAQIEAATAPVWIKWNSKNLEGTVSARPTADNTETPGDVRAILEFYSR
jgi:small subunit ribosomal protein S4